MQEVNNETNKVKCILSMPPRKIAGEMIDIGESLVSVVPRQGELIGLKNRVNGVRDWRVQQVVHYLQEEFDYHIVGLVVTPAKEDEFWSVNGTGAQRG
ncbi:hypothetical protein GA0061096_1352 [Fictibacillus enclensis]|uniref:Uncharacterized protein n=1 Tax=Fictibacillus enclensis TaxID=1017270 RepID=A0A0V8JE81_9BACL|nr:hypothetical protein [Fictibacillus enclensis]KSU85160.1 hypothetical protein AS030_06485 [Fictibacillus enclensis]SCB91956.1 hypothetical protein GA0061096_1352 [Fictibacillus enclensis]